MIYRSVADPDPGLTEDVWHQKYENKKEVLQYYLEYVFSSILDISHRLGCIALDPNFAKWIRNTDYLGQSRCKWVRVWLDLIQNWILRLDQWRK